jgi:hypothetical protein
MAKGVYILSLQAKDIYLANNLLSDKDKKAKGDKIIGYSTRNKNNKGFNLNPTFE